VAAAGPSRRLLLYLEFYPLVVLVLVLEGMDLGFVASVEDALAMETSFSLDQ
jgi:hypothetical protein